MTDKTLAERVADDLRSRAMDIECNSREERQWEALAEFVLAADAEHAVLCKEIDEYHQSWMPSKMEWCEASDRMGRALRALAKALGVE